MPQYNDFEEIAHCGGQIIFTISCGPEGQKQYQTTIKMTRGGPAAWIGVYARIFDGVPILNFNMGGLGQPWDPQCPEGCAPVFLGSDSRECWGCKCPECEKYFRHSEHPSVYPLTCPYCGVLAPGVYFLSDAQRLYIRHYIEQLVTGIEQDMEPNTTKEITIDMDAIVDMADGESRPAFYQAEESQQTQFKCPECAAFNDVRGLYAYCGSCGKRNNVARLEATTACLRADLNEGRITPEDAIRKAASEFDACCRDFVGQLCDRIPLKPARQTQFRNAAFHDLDSDVVQQIQAKFDVDLFRGMKDQRPFVRKMMHRRHVFEHKGGVIDQRYVDESGDAEAQIGDLIRENQGNANDFISAINRMVKNLDSDFHQTFPLTEWPVTNHQEYLARIQNR
nr:hypothetical protein [uncultured Hyphomonas sp.]